MVYSIVGPLVLGALLAAAQPGVLVRQDVSADTGTEVGSTNSPCAKLALMKTRTFPPAMVRDCLRSTPFVPEAKDNIMAVASTLYTTAVFQYNQLGDEHPEYDQNVDVWAESTVARINETEYGSDYDFQMDLSQVMYSLNDGHHAWEPCYQYAFSTRHAFPIIAVKGSASSAENNDAAKLRDRVNVHLPPDLPMYAARQGVEAMYTQRGINTTYLAGARVNRVQGKDVWNYLDEDARPIAGRYPTFNQRFESLFTGITAYYTFGTIGKNIGRFASRTFLPDEDELVLSLTAIDGKEVDVAVPWVTRFTAGATFDFTTGSDTYQALCGAQTASTLADKEVDTTAFAPTGAPIQAASFVPKALKARADTPTELEEYAQQLYANCPVSASQTLYPLPESVDPQLSSNYLGGRDVQFYTLDDNRTGVIFIPTFQPIGNDVQSCRERFQYDAYFGVQNLTKAGVERVLIDTSNNNGGENPLSQFMQRVLAGHKYLNELNLETVFVKAPLADAIVEAHLKYPEASYGTYNPQNFRNESLTDFDASYNYLEHGDKREINGHELEFSMPLRDTVGNVLAFEDYFNMTEEAPFAPENIKIVGNGLCASACGMFTRFLIEYFNVTAYINTPRPEENIEFQACAGGQVMSTDFIYYETQPLNITEEQLPTLQVPGAFSFSVRAALSTVIAPGEFIQYLPYPAQERYTQTMEQFVSPLANWNYIAGQVFGK